MTIRTTKTVSKLIAFCLTAALLWGTAGGYKTFLGPGLTDAAALSVEQEQLVFPSAQSLTASTTKYTNILVEVRVAVNNVRNLTFFLNNTSTVDLKFYDSSINTEAYTIDNSENQLEVQYTPYGNDPSGTAILRSAYNTTAAFTTASNAITTDVNGGMYTNLSSITIHDESVVSMLKVQVGDISGDGLVNAVDAQMALQAGVNTITLTHAQALAGDVNRDGTIDAVDALKINQYAVSTILSFWGGERIVEIISPETPPVTDGDSYYVKGVNSGEYLGGSPTSSTVVATPKQINNPIYGTSFTVSYGDTGLCAIKNLANNKYLCMNSSGDAEYITSPTNFSQFWILSSSANGYYFVSYINSDYLLLEDGSVGRDIANALWCFESIVIIKYNYNYGYRYRMGTDAAANAELSARQGEIATILNRVFNVSVQTEGVARFIAREDLCYTTVASPTVADVIAAVGADEVADQSTTNPHPCPNSHCTDPICEDKEQANTHHRNASKGLDHYSSYKGANLHKIWLLTSGYEPCHVWDHDEDGVETHGYGTIAGLAGGPSNRVAGVYHGDSGNTYKNTLTALHEVSHCLGAIDEPADTKHGNCVMSYNRSDEYLMQLYNSESPTRQRLLYCDACYAQIVEQLKYY